MSDDEALRRLYGDATSAASPAGEHPDEALWERVICGEAGVLDAQDVQAHVLTCATCAAIYRALLEVRREAAAFDPDMPAASAPRDADVGPSVAARDVVAPPRRVARWIPYAAAAGGVIAIAAAWMALRTPTIVPASADATNASVPAPALALAANPVFRLEKAPVMLSLALSLTPRGAADGNTIFLDAFGEAMAPYRADDFAEAATRLTRLGERYPALVEPALYAGVSLLLAGRPADGVVELERARDLAQPEFADEVRWRLALAYVHAGSPARAADPLARVCAGSGPYRNRACQAAALVAERRLP